MLVTLAPGETRQITFAASQAHLPPTQKYLIANTDETSPVYIGPADAGRQTPDLTSDPARSILVALQAVAVSAEQDWFAFNPSGDLFSDTIIDTFGGTPVVLDILPDTEYWSPSPAQVAAQISGLGLMLDSTGQVIHTTMGAPAQNSAVTAVQSAVMGLQPPVSSVSSLRNGAPGSPYTVFTFAADSRIWALHLSFAAATDSTFSGGLTNLYAELSTGSGLALTVVELAVSAANQTVNGDSDLAFSNGIPISAGDTLILDVNNANALADGNIRASCTALYSSP